MIEIAPTNRCKKLQEKRRIVFSLALFLWINNLILRGGLLRGFCKSQKSCIRNNDNSLFREYTLE
jgi:hypothetical protein